MLPCDVHPLRANIGKVTVRASREHQRHFTMFPARRPHGDLNVLSERDEKVHKALDRKIAGLAAHQGRYARLLDAQYLASPRLREAAMFDNPVKLQREPRFELLAFGVGEAGGRERRSRYPPGSESCCSPSSQFCLSR